MSNKRLGLVLGVVVAACAIVWGVWTMVLQPGRAVPSVPAARAVPASADEAMSMLLAASMDPYADRTVLLTLLNALPPSERASWWDRLAAAMVGMDPEGSAGFRRELGYMAISTGYWDAAWSILLPVADCEHCPPEERLDALRLLDQFTPEADSRRRDLTDRVVAEANRLVEAPVPSEVGLPIIWSAMLRMDIGGRAEESIQMREVYIRRFADVVGPAGMIGTVGNQAYALQRAGRLDEARPLFLKVAEHHNGPVLTFDRANALSHAAAAGTPAEAVALLEGVMQDPNVVPSASTALIGLELVQAHLKLNQPENALATAERVWRDIGPDAPPNQRVDPTAGAFTEASQSRAAMVCYHASRAAAAVGRRAEADMWTRRAIQIAPNSPTAQALRRSLGE
jgi:tetratricopeptide (TPR) repeat protein